MKTVPDRARVVIMGGGIIGCSVAYHLAKQGWTDIVLLERKQLTCGTTWHAAGLIAQLRASQNMTRLARYSQELYGALEAETGIATGFRRNGSVTVALSEHRREEIFRQASMARTYGVEVERIDPDAIAALYPHLNLDGVLAGVHLPLDGQGDPANIALALAKGATRQGAQVIEGVEVTGTEGQDRRIDAVTWKRGDETGRIACDHVVNCGGMWAHSLGRMSGVNVPLHACEHFYIVTDPIDGLRDLPVLRVPDECAYYKEDAGKMLLGAFEPEAKPWGMDGIPTDFCFDELPPDFDHFEGILEMAVNRVPMLAEAGIRTFFNGPESFTPDDSYHLGQAPEMDNYWVAAGFNSIGIQSAGGAGMALAQWMDAGEKPFDLGDVDIARMQPFQGNRTYLFERAKEALGLLYADHYPYRQKDTARGVRRSPLHEHLRARGAVFGEFAGWERANWFATDGQAPEYRHDWHRQNWFDNAAREHRAIREGVGLYDMSSFGKIRIEGPDAEDFLNYVCGANLAVPPGRLVYTQMLNSRGGIEADVTVARLTSDAFLMVTPAATCVADMARLKRLVGDRRVVILDVTSAEAVISVMGPKSRDLMARVSPDDLGSEAFPFGALRQIELGLGTARAHRVSYVGELGWELYVPTDMAAHAFEVVEEAGQDMGLTLCGLHVMDGCRLEKGFRHFGHDITCEDHVLEAGLGFAVPKAKTCYIGHDAVQRKRNDGLSKRLVQFRLTEPDAMVFHAEPILRGGEMVGHLTSGAFGHHLGAPLGMGYVGCEGETPAELLASDFDIEIAGRRVKADASLKPFYDPSGGRMRA